MTCLLNKAKIIHSREVHEDNEALDCRRHLLRLRLSALAFSSVEDRPRSGIPSR